MAVAGRPRTFDKEVALTKAMHVFWEKGFEGTTMADLVQAIGMKAPSLYAAFGNKDALFSAVVSHYLPIITNGQLAALNNTSHIAEAVDKTLAECVKLFTSQDNPQSCLIMTAAINTAPEHSAHVAELQALRKVYQAAWVGRFEKAKADHQLIEDTDAVALAEYFTTVILGMALRAKDSASQAELSKTAALSSQVLVAFLTKS